MAWIAKKPVTVVRNVVKEIEGKEVEVPTKLLLQAGSPVPEAKTWKNPQRWCDWVADSDATEEILEEEAVGEAVTVSTTESEEEDKATDTETSSDDNSEETEESPEDVDETESEEEEADTIKDGVDYSLKNNAELKEMVRAKKGDDFKTRSLKKDDLIKILIEE